MTGYMKTMMDKFVMACMLVICGISCTGKGSGGNEKISAVAMDSVLWADSMLVDISEKPLPQNIDGSFEDFFIQYAYDPELQLVRTLFPLSCSVMGKDTILRQSDWQDAGLLGDIRTYSTIYEREADMEIEKDSSLNNVLVQIFDLNTEKVRECSFIRQDKRWMLGDVDEYPLAKSADRDFVRFYHHFVDDSLFQSAHVQDPLFFVTMDPEDDFNILEATIDMEQWFAFAPPLPEREFVVLNYGAKAHRRGPKIMTMKSVVDEFCCTLYFRRSGSEWVLYKYENVSN